MLEKYSSIYNKNGRIGIYTRDVRFNPFSLASTIIQSLVSGEKQYNPQISRQTEETCMEEKDSLSL